MIENKKRIIGLMSGTSLDGLDICCADFWMQNEQYNYEIIAAETVQHPTDIIELLQSAYTESKEKLQQSSITFGQQCALKVDQFIGKNNINDIDYIASHGHTIFHEPSKGITVQIGDGKTMANQLHLPVINDFRIGDVELGGQGAPLVPIGDRLLFGHVQSCLNLGGIANISFEHNQERIAFDIGPANLPLNHYCTKILNLPYDKNGQLAREGKVIQELLDQLNDLPFHKEKPPKSLGYEWMEKRLFPICEPYTNQINNLLRTLVEYETDQIAQTITDFDLNEVLITGGGSYNSFFIERLQSKSNCDIISTSATLIEFKEALVFGFLGYLRSMNRINILSSVTGAERDSCGGIIHHPSI